VKKNKNRVLIFLYSLASPKWGDNDDKIAIQKYNFLGLLILFTLIGNLTFMIVYLFLNPQFSIIVLVSYACLSNLIALIANKFKKYDAATLFLISGINIPLLFAPIVNTSFYDILYLIAIPILLAGFLFKIKYYFILLIINLSFILLFMLFLEIPILYLIEIFMFLLILSILLYISTLRRKRMKNNQRNELIQSLDATIYALAYQAELRDYETAHHLDRTANYTRIIAEELQNHPKYSKYVSDKYIEELVKSSILHDIGKVGISDAILLKPGKLDEDEFAMIKKHPEYGRFILKKAQEKLSFRSFFDIAAQIIEYHHERWDGNGYPKKLRGDKIPLSARIVALADVYDALRSLRPYKNPIDHEKCVEIIKSTSGDHFDPEIIECFLKREKDFDKIANKFKD